LFFFRAVYFYIDALVG